MIRSKIASSLLQLTYGRKSQLRNQKSEDKSHRSLWNLEQAPWNDRQKCQWLFSPSIHEFETKHSSRRKKEWSQQAVNPIWKHQAENEKTRVAGWDLGLHLSRACPRASLTGRLPTMDHIQEGLRTEPRPFPSYIHHSHVLLPAQWEDRVCVYVARREGGMRKANSQGEGQKLKKSGKPSGQISLFHKWENGSHARMCPLEHTRVHVCMCV